MELQSFSFEKQRVTNLLSDILLTGFGVMSKIFVQLFEVPNICLTVLRRQGTLLFLRE